MSLLLSRLPDCWLTPAMWCPVPVTPTAFPNLRIEIKNCSWKRLHFLKKLLNNSHEMVIEKHTESCDQVTSSKDCVLCWTGEEIEYFLQVVKEKITAIMMIYNDLQKVGSCTDTDLGLLVFWGYLSILDFILVHCCCALYGLSVHIAWLWL